MTMTNPTVKSEFPPDNSPYENLISSLPEFGITQNQAKVYLYLSKNAAKSAPEISKNLKIPRTETYHLINVLQSKGIVISNFGKPTKFQALPFDKSIRILVNNHRTRIDELEKQTSELITIWNTMPESNNQTKLISENRFQMLQGKNSIVGKLNHLISSTKKEILILGSENNFKKFYQTRFFEQLQNVQVNLKILILSTKKTSYHFPEFPSYKTKIFHNSTDENLWFLIKDGEVFFILRNDEDSEMLAVWTDSYTMHNSMKMLFNMIWKTTNLVVSS